MSVWANGDIYVPAGEKLSNAWASKSKPFGPRWSGKGQIYVCHYSKLMWKKTPWASASHKSGKTTE